MNDQNNKNHVSDTLFFLNDVIFSNHFYFSTSKYYFKYFILEKSQKLVLIGLCTKESNTQKKIPNKFINSKNFWDKKELKTIHNYKKNLNFPLNNWILKRMLLKIGIPIFFKTTNSSINIKEKQVILRKNNMNKPFIKIKSKRKHKSINSSIPFVSITHRKNNIFIAISDKPIGIDCEYIKKYSNAWKKKMFSEEEVLISEDFFNKRDIFDKETIYIIMWCLKESTNKLCGYYLIGDLPKIRIEVKNECLTTYISKKKDMYNNYISILDDLILVVTM